MVRNKGLQFRITGSLIILLLLIIGGQIFFNLAALRHDIKLATARTTGLVAAALGSSLRPALAANDRQALAARLDEHKRQLADIDIFIFNANRQITFATVPANIGGQLAETLNLPATAAALDPPAGTNRSGWQTFENRNGDGPCLTMLQPVMNQGSCHSCHDPDRLVLGGIAVRQDLRPMYATIGRLRLKNIGAGLVVMLLAVAVVYLLIARQVIGPMRRTKSRLDDSARGLSGVAGEMATTSQNLAKGANEQAAALEETSASFEEITSMIKQSDGNSRQADLMAGKAGEQVQEANNSMAKLIKSMHEISSAGEQTQKIVKTIDEIAFQTNLLALNAAVEAARAGEAGAGFAVVADEVRNLALRSAEAARSTSELIDSTSAKITDGSNLVRKTNEAFEQVAVEMSMIADLIKEVAAASREQSEGIDHIGRAINEIDAVTQHNAADSEELAATGDELAKQTTRMKNLINRLDEIITGAAGPASQTPGPETRAAAEEPPRPPAGRLEWQN